jgi:hypothetical protein
MKKSKLAKKIIDLSSNYPVVIYMVNYEKKLKQFFLNRMIHLKEDDSNKIEGIFRLPVHPFNEEDVKKVIKTLNDAKVKYEIIKGA